MNREKLLRALRARGKSDALAQMAADEIEGAPEPAGFFLTEGAVVLQGEEAEAISRMKELADASIIAARKSAPAAKKAAAKKAKSAKRE